MITVGAFEAKTHFSRLLEQVRHGEQVTILWHGSPVARLIPNEKTINKNKIKEAIEHLKTFSQRHTLEAKEPIKNIYRRGLR